MNIEVEIRSFISEEEYERLMKFFKENSEFLVEDDQITLYFSGNEDIRIQKSKKFAKVWMKRGKIHDEHREEIEVKFKTEEFDKMLKIFTYLGYEIEIKWIRKRNSFKWDDIDVMIDHTQGYGYIIELEKISNEKDKLTITVTECANCTQHCVNLSELGPIGSQSFSICFI